MNRQRKDLTVFVLSMLIFGTIGLFRRWIGLPSGMIASLRGIAGAAFLFICAELSHRTIHSGQLKKYLIPLLLSGAAMGFNWIFLFEAYRYTTVAIATLCYYMEPVILIAASPFVLHEKLTVRKVLAVLTAVFGMVLISGAGGSALTGESMKGIGFGLAAALLYAIVVLFNKKMPEVDSYDRTMTQLFIAGVLLIPYVFLKENPLSYHPDAMDWIMLAIICLVHTGIAYIMFFSSMDGLSAQTIAIAGYIDPLTATVLSALFLKEPMTVIQAAGAVLILAAAFISGA